jgi:hypothetical protein
MLIAIATMCSVNEMSNTKNNCKSMLHLSALLSVMDEKMPELPAYTR